MPDAPPPRRETPAEQYGVKAVSEDAALAANGSAASDPRRWYTTNLVGIPASLLGSTQFNEHPQPLRIAGTRETHPGLFALLDRTGTLEEAGEVFAHYLRIAFGLGPPAPDARGAERRRSRSSYLRLLQGWGFDANGPQGAVLKGWVESRFGLVPGYHKAPLGAFPSPAWVAYLEEKAGSRYHNNCINMQLDLLFEYCQWSLVRFARLGPRHVRLWRGVNRCEEQIVVGSLHEAHDGHERRCVVRLNNLVSFSLLRERVQAFGDWILEAEVPTAKLLFYPGLIANHVLSGEGEVLVIGGDFDVGVSYA